MSQPRRFKIVIISLVFSAVAIYRLTLLVNYRNKRLEKTDIKQFHFHFMIDPLTSIYFFHCNVYPYE